MCYICVFVIFSCSEFPGEETESENEVSGGQVLDRTDRLTGRKYMVVVRRLTTEREVWLLPTRFVNFQYQSYQFYWSRSFCSKHLPSLSFWAIEQPDNWEVETPAGEDCVRMGIKTGAEDLKCWFDKYCKVPHRRICERKSTKTGYWMCPAC